MLINFKEENYHTNEVLIKDLLSKNSLWSNQAFELLQMFKEEQQFKRIVEMVLPKIIDQHNRFKILEHFKENLQTLLTRVYSSMGQAMFFNFFNPSGHYNLNLSVPGQREVANIILLLNKQFAIKVKAGEFKDRSQKGNASCLRNEKVSGGSFTWTPDYILPQIGNFQFDFVYMVPNRPSIATATKEDEVMALMSWFTERY